MTPRPATGRSRRVTPRGTGPDDELPDLRRRNPLVWWIAVIALVGLVVGTVGGGLVVVLG